MKRIAIVCTLLCILGVTALNAQNQGDMYISGSIGIALRLLLRTLLLKALEVFR